ncbi:MAG: hypothetical protein H3Z53_08595 [archaeon]|nr:hypothetical protein [archaeon]MCP8319807.1 hypothetical protein [archaeon]
MKFKAKFIFQGTTSSFPIYEEIYADSYREAQRIAQKLATRMGWRLIETVKISEKDENSLKH